MAAPSPSLSLSDLIHPFSPPPMPMQPKSSSPPLRARSVTPEPLELPEIEEMRRKILAMGWGDLSKGKEKAGDREQELVDMLLRLTHPASLPQPSQLHAQAETIAHLIQQRDFLVQRSMEERERWECEKEGWARAAQALIAQGRRESVQAESDAIAAQYALVTVDASTQRVQEFERANVILQNDKKILQQKLADAQKRLVSFESELAQLKPLLLMQPFALTHSHPTGTARGWSAVLPSTSSAPPSRREKDRHGQGPDPDVDDEPESDDETPHQPPLQPRPQFRNPVLRPATHEGHPQPLAPPGSPFKPKGDYYRRRDPPSPSVYHPSAQHTKPGRRKAGHPPSGKPAMSDARAEHLLLAARKIGHKRASILSGAFAHVTQPEPMLHSKQKGASASQPKAQPQPPRTPRRNANASTPLLTRTPLGQPSGQPPNTPLQSLLSAAQSVLSAPGSVSPSASPVAKRRKLDPSVTITKSADTPLILRKEKDKDNKDKAKLKDKDKHSESDKPGATLPGGVARVRSALDFLADQAEVYSTQPSQTSADSSGSPPKDLEDVPPQDVEMGNEHDITSAAEKGKNKALTPAPLSRPNTPVSDEKHAQLPRSGSGRNSRATTPIDVIMRPTEEPPNGHGPTPPSTTLNTFPSTLAPAIDLTPRASRSPAPQTTPRKRSRSSSTERPGTSAPPAECAFNMVSMESPRASPGQAVDLDVGQIGATPSRGVDGVRFAVDVLPRRTRSPYIKWTKEEDELLAKAVAKHGQRWDLVQKALPARGYHQVRQRWLRKLGVFDNNKLDLASLETNAAAEFLNLSTAPPIEDNDGSGGRPSSDPRSTANPKLGLAPLDSERVLTASSSRSLSPYPTSGSGTAGSGPGLTLPSDIVDP